MSTGSFHIVPGETVIIRRGGVFKQVEVYQYGGFLFAKSNGGYIRLLMEGGTSVPNTMHENLQVKYRVGEFGRLVKN